MLHSTFIVNQLQLQLNKLHLPKKWQLITQVHYLFITLHQILTFAYAQAVPEFHMCNDYDVSFRVQLLGRGL
jgi:hypothetical protein